jgi:hypothetical protein
VGGGGREKKLTVKGQGVREKKKKTQNPVLGLGWVSSYPKKIPKPDFFGWCTGGCWVTEAHQEHTGLQTLI